MVELVFIGRDSGGIVNTIEIIDNGSYGTNNVSIGITVQYGDVVLYQDAAYTYSINKGGSIIIPAPYDEDGILTGNYFVQFQVRNDDTQVVTEYTETVTLSYVPYQKDITINIDGLSSTISVTDNNPYTGAAVSNYELSDTDPNGIKYSSATGTLSVPATIYSGVHNIQVVADITWTEAGVTLYDRVVFGEAATAYKLDYAVLFSQIDILNSIYEEYLETNITEANRIKDKVNRCNVWQDDFERAITDNDTQSAYYALVYINEILNPNVIPAIEEIPVFTIVSPVGHTHSNKIVLDSLSDVGGVLYYNSSPVESSGQVRMTAIDSMGYLSDKLGSEFGYDGSNKIILSVLGTAGTYGSESKSLTIITDTKGRVSSVVANDIQISTSQVMGLTGQLGSYVLSTDYEDLDVLNKIKNVDGSGSGLDADYLRGNTLGQTGTGYIPYVDSNGYFGLNKTSPAYLLDVNGTARIGELNGIIKGTAGVLGVATGGVDYVIPNTAITASVKTKIQYDAKGLVVAGYDATTTDIAEGSNQYFTQARVRSTPISGYVATEGTVAASDTVLEALQKLGYDQGVLATKLSAFSVAYDDTKTAFLTYSNDHLYWNHAYLDHNGLLNYSADRHALLDDGQTTSSNVWSASKITTELGGYTRFREVRLNSGATVAQRLSGLVEGTDYPTGWVLTDDGAALVITHSLNSLSGYCAVMSKNGTTSDVVKLEGAKAYGTYTNVYYNSGYNRIRIDALATDLTELYLIIQI